MTTKRQSSPCRRIVILPSVILLSISMLGLSYHDNTTLAQQNNKTDKQPDNQPDNPQAQQLFAGLGGEARNALVNGEPELALRLLAGPNIKSLQQADRDRYRSIYNYALQLRFSQGAEGAIVDLLLHAPNWLNEERTQSAVRLAEWWRMDPLPTREEVTRRLDWFQNLQHTIQPAPLSPNLPVRLILAALDHVDHVNQPMDRVLLLELADAIAPQDPVWSAYQPDAYAMKRAAEQMEREEKYLAAEEIYRRLIYQSPDDADWFKRKYAENQVNRIFALSTIAGADFAMRAAAQLRQDYLGPTEKVRFQLLKKHMQEAMTQYELTRRLPRILNHPMTLTKIPVAYLIPDQLTIEKGGSLTVEPGTVIRGGTIILKGGTINLKGTDQQPVIIVDLTIESDDEQGGGIFTARNTQFRRVSIRRNPMLSVTAGAFRINIDHAYADHSSFPFDSLMNVNLQYSELKSCEITIPRTNTDNKSSNIANANNNNKNDAPSLPTSTITYCIFRNSRINDTLAVFATHSKFIDCAITQWVTNTTSTTNKSDYLIFPTSRNPPTTRLIENIYIPDGLIPAQIQRKSNLTGPNRPILIFSPTTTEPILRLGNVKRWIQ